MKDIRHFDNGRYGEEAQQEEREFAGHKAQHHHTFAVAAAFAFHELRVQRLQHGHGKVAQLCIHLVGNGKCGIDHRSEKTFSTMAIPCVLAITPEAPTMAQPE